MPQPFDYRIQVQNPMEAALSGLRLGAGIQEMRDARAAAMAKAEADRQFQESYQSVLANPNATGEDYGRLVAMRPDLQQSIAKSWEMRDESSRKADLQSTQKAYFAAMNGDPQTAANVLLENATAYRNSGREEDAKRMEAAADSIAANPAQAKATMGLFLASVAPKDWAETVSKVGAETRAQEVAPYESEVKRVDASYAEKMAEATLAKMAADAKKVKDEETGLVPADKRVEWEQKFRLEGAKAQESFVQSGRLYDKVVTSDASFAGDVSLMAGFMKLQDPNASVMEGDYLRAEQLGNISTKAAAVYNKLLSDKGTLTDAQRAEFRAQAKKLYDAEKKRADLVRSGITRIALKSGLDPANIFYEVETQVDY